MSKWAILAPMLDDPARYRRFYVDVASIIALQATRRRLFRGLAESRIDVIIVIDAWSKTSFTKLNGVWFSRLVLREDIFEHV